MKMSGVSSDYFKSKLLTVTQVNEMVPEGTCDPTEYGFLCVSLA